MLHKNGKNTSQMQIISIEQLVPQEHFLQCKKVKHFWHKAYNIIFEITLSLFLFLYTLLTFHLQFWISKLSSLYCFAFLHIFQNSYTSLLRSWIFYLHKISHYLLYDFFLIYLSNYLFRMCFSYKSG